MSRNVIQFTIKGIDLASPAFKRVTTAAVTAAKRIGTAFRKLQAQLSSVGGLLATVGAGLLVKSFIQAASTSENLRVRLRVLLGTVAEGNRLFDEMADFASKVPFEFEEIMQSATTLTGVVKGGVDEVTRFMPLIADLAATSGLSLQETTGQVVRMFSAGAGAADLFRERGILAMLGFEAGVAISAEKTKRRLIEAWEAPGSKFRGATELLATTWTGLISMMSDKWFQFRNLIMDSGLLNFIKAIAIIINERLGKSLEDTKVKAADWANTIINGMKAVATAVGVMMDGIRGIQFVWIAAELGFSMFKLGLLVGVDAIRSVWHNLVVWLPRAWDAAVTMISIAWENVKLGFQMAAHLITLGWQNTVNTILEGYNFLVNASPWLAEKLGIEGAAMATWSDTSMAAMDRTKAGILDLTDAYKERAATVAEAFSPNTEGLDAAAEAVKRISDELELLALTPMPSESIRAFMAEVEIEFTRLQEITRQQMQETLDGVKETTITATVTLIDALGEILESFRDKQGTFNEEFAKSLFKTMLSTTKAIGKGVVSVMVDGAKASEVFKNILRDVLKQTIAGFITLKIQRLLSAKSAVGQAGANTLASMSAAPFPVNLTAPAVAAAHAAQTAAYAVSVAAHGGLGYVPQEMTALLTRGERIVSPKQNRDLTDFLDGGGGGGSTIGDVTVNIYTTATTFEDIDDVELEEFVGGRLLRTLDKLDGNGVRQQALERSNA